MASPGYAFAGTRPAARGRHTGRFRVRRRPTRRVRLPPPTNYLPDVVGGGRPSMGTRKSRRTIDLGRRVEALPVWAFVLLTITAAVVVLAVFFATLHHTAADGTDCGSAIYGERAETAEYTVAGRQTV